MEKAKSRKKQPWHLKRQYRRIMAFMLMVAMLFVDVGNSASVAYAAVAKEKVRVHAQIDSEAVIDTLIATGGYGVGFDDEIGDYLLSNAQSQIQAEHVYDQLLEEVNGDNRHLIAQRRVGGLGLFLIAENDTDNFVSPDNAYLDETVSSSEVFSLFSKGELISDESVEDLEEDPEECFGGEAMQRQAVADTIDHLILLAVNFDKETNYEVRTTITGEELEAVEGKLITTSYKEKKEKEEVEVETLPAEVPSETEGTVPEETTVAEETTASEESTDVEETTVEETTAEETTSVEETTATETETSEEAPVETPMETAEETEAPAETVETKAPETESSETEAPAEETEDSDGEATIEEHDVPTVQSALTIQVPAAEETEAPETEEATGSVVEIVPEDVPMAPAPEESEEATTEAVEETETVGAVEDTTAEDTTAETAESANVPEIATLPEVEEIEEILPEETLPEATEPTETSPEETLPVETESTDAPTEEVPEISTLPAVPEGGNSSEIIEDDVLEVTIKVDETALKESELKSLFAEGTDKATPSEATPAEAEGGFRMTVKPYTVMALDLIMQTGVLETEFGTLYIENNTETGVAYQVKLSDEASEEPVPYNGEVVITALGDENAESRTETITDGSLYLDPMTAAAIENLPSDTKYEVEILPPVSLLEENETEGETAEQPEMPTFDDGSTKAAGVIENGASLRLENRNPGTIKIAVVEPGTQKGISGISFELKKDSQTDSQTISNGVTDEKGQLSLDYDQSINEGDTLTLYVGGKEIAKYRVGGKVLGLGSRRLNVLSYGSPAGYTIQTGLGKSTSIGNETTKPVVYIEKEPSLTITPVIQGNQIDTAFSYKLTYASGEKSGQPYDGTVTVDGAEQTLTDGILTIPVGEAAVISGVTDTLTIVAQKHQTHAVNRIIKNGTLVASSNEVMEYFGGEVELSYSYRAAVTSAGGIEVTKTATATETPGRYDMELTVKGQPKTEEQIGNVSVLLVLDKSRSMSFGMNGDDDSKPSRDSVMVKAAKQMINTVLGDGNTNNKMGVITYSSHGQIRQEWTSNPRSVTNAVSVRTSAGDEGGTNCQAGFVLADQLLSDLSEKDNSQKFVVYLSDGEPDRSNEHEYDKYSNSVYIEDAVKSAKQLRQNHPEVTIMTLGVSESPGKGVLAPQGEDKYWDQYAKVTKESDFSDAFQSITDIITSKQENPVVKDVLGKDVDLVNGSIKTTVSVKGKEPDPQGTATYDKENDTITWDVIDTKKYPTAGDTADELTSLDRVYTLTYQVTVTSKPDKKPYDQTGDDHTGTHAGQKGYWSNESAELFCNNSTTFPTAVFPQPVVQNGASASLYIKKTVNSVDGTALPGATFTLYSKDASGNWENKVASGTTDENGLLTLNGLYTGNVYKLVETGVPDGYQKAEDIFVTAVLEGETVKVYRCSEAGDIQQEIKNENPLVIVNMTETAPVKITVTKNLKDGKGAGLTADQKTFNFILTEGAGNETASTWKVQIPQGQTTVSTNTETQNLKPGLYKFTEDSNSLFTLDSIVVEGAGVDVDGISKYVENQELGYVEGTFYFDVLSEGNITITVTNTLNSELGSITLKKAVTNGLESDKSVAYTFEVADNLDFANAEEIQVTPGTTVTLSGLDLDKTYYIREQVPTGMQLTGIAGAEPTETESVYRFTLADTTALSLEATNERVSGSMTLNVKKEIIGGEGLSAADKNFSFTMTDPNRNSYTGNAIVENGTLAEVSWENAPDFANMPYGEYTITENLGENSKFAFTDVQFKKGSGEKVDNGVKFTLGSTDNNFEIVFQNTVIADGSIVIDKVLENPLKDEDRNKEFVFTLKTSDGKEMKQVATDATNAIIEGLQPGTYYLTEQNDANYELKSVTVNGETSTAEEHGYSIVVDGKTAVRVEVTNAPKTFKGSMIFNKEVTGTALLNADGENIFTFALKTPTGMIPVEIPVSIDGNYASGTDVTINAPDGGWVQGTYTLTEMAVNGKEEDLNNYVLSVEKKGTTINTEVEGKTITFTIDESNVDSKEPIKVVAKNALDTVDIGNATLIKTVSSGNELIPEKGFTFTITAPNGEKATVSVPEDRVGKKEDISGILTEAFGEKLPIGTYTITEADSDIFELSSLVVKVGDRSTTDGSFVLTNADEEKDISITAVNKVKTSDKKLSVVKGVKIPKGMLNADMNDTFEFSMTMPDGKTVTGTITGATTADNMISWEGVTDITKMDLPYGTYTITETPNDNYTTTSSVSGAADTDSENDSVTFTLKPESTGEKIWNTIKGLFTETDLITVTFTNTPKSGNIEFQKVESLGNQPLEGAEFTLYQGEKEIVTAASDETGKVSFVNVAYGDYKIKETKAPAGYQLNTTVYEITVNGETVGLKDVENNTVVNTAKQHKISVTKSFEENDAPDVLLKATFGLFDSKTAETPLQTVTVTGNGSTAVFEKAVNPGTYWVKELDVTNGYIKSEEPVEVVVNADDSEAAVNVTFNNELGTYGTDRELTIKKVLESGEWLVPEDGKNFTFQIIDKTGETVGKATATVPYGEKEAKVTVNAENLKVYTTYYLQEDLDADFNFVKAEANGVEHTTNPIPFMLVPGQDSMITVTNKAAVITGVQLNAEKEIVDGSESIPAEQFGVRVTKAFGDYAEVANGTTEAMNVGTKAFTIGGFDGILAPGNYKVEEYAPNGTTRFTQVGQPIVIIDGEKVSVDHGIFYVPAGTETIDIQITNTPSTTAGGLEVTKTFESGESLAEGHTFEFTLTKDGSDLSYTGKVTYVKGGENKVIWDATGTTLLTGLQLGNYTLTETSDNYQNLSIPVVINSTDETKVAVTASNKVKEAGTLTVNKVFTDDAILLNDHNDTTFRFKVTNMDTKTGYEGTVAFSKDDDPRTPKPVIWKDTQETVLEKLPYGTYLIEEIQNDHYVVSFEGSEGTVVDNGVFTIQESNKNVTITATNAPVIIPGGNVTLTKEIEEYAVAEGADLSFEYELYDVSVDPNTVVATARTTSVGDPVVFISGDKQYNYIFGHKYVVKEVDDPYYEVTKMTGKVPANYDKETQSYMFLVNTPTFMEAITVTNTAKKIPFGSKGNFKIAKALENDSKIENEYKDFTFEMRGTGGKENVYTATISNMYKSPWRVTWKDANGNSVMEIPYDVYTITETSSGELFQLDRVEIPMAFGGKATVKDGVVTVVVDDEAQKWSESNGNLITFINVPRNDGTLTIKKEITGGPTFEGDEFTFRLYEKDSNNKYQEVAGKTITIKAGDSATITGLTIGKTYYVREDDHVNYELSKISSDPENALKKKTDGYYEFTLGKDDVKATITAIVTNKHKTAAIEIGKVVEEINPQPNAQFTIRLTPTNKALPVIGATLPAGGSEIPDDQLVYGETYTVTEDMGEWSDWFTQTKIEIIKNDFMGKPIVLKELDPENPTFIMSEEYAGALIQVTNKAAVSNVDVTVNKALTGGYSLAAGQTFALTLKDAAGNVVFPSTVYGEDVAAAENHLLHAFTVQNLPYGTYTVEETINGDVFEQKNIQMQDADGMDDIMVLDGGTFTIAPGSTDKVITVVNGPKEDGKVVVEKQVIDHITANLVNGEMFTFTIVSEENNYEASKTVTYTEGGTNNLAVFEHVPYGNYTIKEITSENSFVKLNSIMGATPDGQFVVNSPVEVKLIAKNEPKTGTSVTVKKFIDKGNFVNEDDTFIFELLDMDGKVLARSEKVNANDEAVTFKNADGTDFAYTYGHTYQIAELVPQNYELLSYRVNGLAVANGQFTYTGQDVEIVVENAAKRGSLTITKVDAENADVKLTGVEFELYPGHLEKRPNGMTRIWNSITDGVVYTGTTDEEGTLTIENIPVGEYTLFETKTAENYVLPENGQIVIIRENETTVLTVENTRAAFEADLTIEKTINGRGLEGRMFYFDTYRVGENGEEIRRHNDIPVQVKVGTDYAKTTLNNQQMQAGLYYIVEESGADYTVSYADSKDIRYSQFNPNQRLGQQEVTVGETTETRFYFDVTAENAANIVIQAVNSIKRVENLTMAAKKLWTAENFAVNVPASMDFEFELQQEIDGVYTKIADGKVTNLAEANSSADTQDVLWTVNGIETTVLGNMEYGNYRMVEQVPETFTLDEVALHLADVNWKPLTSDNKLIGFEFTLDETVDSEDEKQAVLQFTNSMNYQGKPEEDGGLVFSKVNAADLGQKLSGAEFTLYRATKEADNKVAVFASDETGTVTIAGAAPGKYYLKETKAPVGYEISDAMITFTVTADGHTVDVTGLAGEDGNYYFTNTKTPDGGGNNGGGDNSGGNNGGGGGGSHTYPINDPDIPLAPLPGGDTVIIEDGEIPLAPLPKTGDRGTAGKLTAILSGILLAAYAMLSSKKKEEEN